MNEEVPGQLLESTFDATVDTGSMTMSKEVDKLFAAIASVQEALSDPVKASTNPHFKSRYADLSAVLDSVRGAYAVKGLSIIQGPGRTAGNVVELTTLIGHKSGQWISCTASATLTKNDPQGYGSVTTYLRRYSLAAMCGVAQQDDDANEATGGGAKPATAPQATQQSAPPAQAPPPAAKPKPVMSDAAAEALWTAFCAHKGSSDPKNYPELQAIVIELTGSKTVLTITDEEAARVANMLVPAVAG